jgi:mannose-1-phosphate guanylyltransferase
LLSAGERFVGYEGEFYWSKIGTLEAYTQAQHDVLLGKVRVKVSGQKQSETLWVGENARIHPCAALTGYVVVG